MDQPHGIVSIGRRDLALMAGAAGLLATLPGAAVGAPRRGGALNVATVGEPPTLDPMESPADVVGMVSQHVFETLYTWGEGWRIVPLLAAADPDISADGRTYTIPLREGVRFHDGTTMTAQDVLASLQRWIRIAQRGRQVAENLDSLTSPDARRIRIALKQPYAPLLSFLSLQTSAAIVIPAAKQAQPMTEFMGTGPFRFVERAPDRYVLLPGSTSTARDRVSRTITAGRARRTWTRSALFPSRTRPRGSRARWPANTTTAVRCRSSRCRGCGPARSSRWCSRASAGP